MSLGVNEILESGILKVRITPESNVLTYQLQLTVIEPDGPNRTPVVYKRVALAEGLELTLESQRAYLLELMLQETGNPCTAAVSFEHNGTVIWDKACTRFGDGFNGRWKYTIQ